MGLHEEKKVIYITKWALTQGILKREATIINFDDSKMEYPMHATIEGLHNLFHIGQDAFLTLEEAQAKAEDIRKIKIASAKKQIEKLEKITFKVK